MYESRGRKKNVRQVAHRYARKIDNTQPDIIKALRGQGAFVYSLAAAGRGCPDLLVTYRGLDFLIECKTDRAGLTPDQERFWADYYSAGGKQLFLVRDEVEALNVVLGGWLKHEASLCRGDAVLPEVRLDENGQHQAENLSASSDEG